MHVERVVIQKVWHVPTGNLRNWHVILSANGETYLSTKSTNEDAALVAHAMAKGWTCEVSSKTGHLLGIDTWVYTR